MGAIVPLLTTTLVSQGIGLAATALKTHNKTEQNNVALDQLKAQQKAQEQQLAQNAALEREKIGLTAIADDEARKAALRRAVARQRANFGAQGVGSGAGSSQAVLLGLFDESDAEKQKRESLDAVRLSAIDQDVSQRKSLNVLQRTQLAERNKLDNLSFYSNLL